jgi:hypothetical protein
VNLKPTATAVALLLRVVAAQKPIALWTRIACSTAPEAALQPSSKHSNATHCQVLRQLKAIGLSQRPSQGSYAAKMHQKHTNLVGT